MLYYMKLILNILESGVKHHIPTTVNFVVDKIHNINSMLKTDI